MLHQSRRPDPGKDTKKEEYTDIRTIYMKGVQGELWKITISYLKHAIIQTTPRLQRLVQADF
jgi:hypothetical protein